MTYTPLEQKFLAQLPASAMLEHRMLLNINRQKRLTTRKTLNKLISDLCRKGALIRLARGRYFVAKGEPIDPFLLGNMALGGYVSFDTALFAYGYRHPFSNTVYCATSLRVKKTIRIAGSVYVGVPVDGFAFGYVYKGKHKIASKAKLLFDMVYTKLKYLEEIEPILSLIRDLDENSINDLVSYLGFVNETAMRERVGFLFKIAGGSTRIISLLKKAIKKSVVVKLNPNVKAWGLYDKEWHVYDNMNAQSGVAGKR